MFFNKSTQKETNQDADLEYEEKPGIVIDCHVEMNVRLPHDVFIKSEGSLHGNITARKVTVEGQVLGNILGTEKVILKNGAKVNGKITAKSLKVDGSVDGEIELMISKSNTFPTLDEDLPHSTNKDELKNFISSKEIEAKILSQRKSLNHNKSGVIDKEVNGSEESENKNKEQTVDNIFW